MKIPRILSWLTTREITTPEGFNPILHESEDSWVEKQQRATYPCGCGENREEMFYKVFDKRRALHYRLQPCKECYKTKNKKRYGKGN